MIEYWLREIALAFEGQKLDFIVLYVRLFIVFTRLASAAQPNDITLSPGPCFMTPMLLFESEFRLPPWPLESLFPGQPTWPPYTSRGLKY